MKRTLNIRLIRAGLTFIILGTASAALPQQSEAVMASDRCSHGGHTWKITPASATGIVSGTSTMFNSTYDTNPTDGDWTSSHPVGWTISDPSTGVPAVTVTNNNASAHSATITAIKSDDSTYVATATVHD